MSGSGAVPRAPGAKQDHRRTEHQVEALKGEGVRPSPFSSRVACLLPASRCLLCPVLAPADTPRPASIEDLLGRDLMVRLDRLDVLSRKVFSGRLPGERRSRRRGASVEFDDYRDYVPGDDLRRIDWNVFARLDRFFIKLFREEEDQSLILVVDASPSMDAGSPSKLVFAQRLAMALGYIGLVNHQRVVPVIIGAPGRAGLQQLAPVRGRRNTQRLASFLLEHAWTPRGDASRTPGVSQRPAPGSSASFTAALKALALSRLGKGVLILLSDFLVREDLRTGLNYLSGRNGFDVHCLQILSPGELEPEREAGGAVVGDLRLLDAETGALAEVTVSGALLRRYKERVAVHVESVRAACASRGMNHAMLRSDTDLARLLLMYLRRRGLLG